MINFHISSYEAPKKRIAINYCNLFTIILRIKKYQQKSLGVAQEIFQLSETIEMSKKSPHAKTSTSCSVRATMPTTNTIKINGEAILL